MVWNKREDRGCIGTGCKCHPAWRGESGVGVGGRNNSNFGFGSDRFVARPARGKYCRAKSRGELLCGFFRCRRTLQYVTGSSWGRIFNYVE